MNKSFRFLLTALAVSFLSIFLMSLLPGSANGCYCERLNFLQIDTTIVKDIDGNIYKPVHIGSFTWLSQNLNTSRFRNGDSIPEVKSLEEWIKFGDQKKPCWCYYENDTLNRAEYGKLYNWFAVADPRGLAPQGWRIPEDKDWNKLTLSLGGLYEANRKLKSSSGWVNNENGTNEVGFDARPGGYRGWGIIDAAGFSNKGYNCFWWSLSSVKEFFAHCRYISLFPNGVFIAQNSSGDTLNRADYWNKKVGMSVRCVKIP